MTTDNSKPVKRIMSTISKHSEEADAEDDEICSGNLWKINDATLQGSFRTLFFASFEIFTRESFIWFGLVYAVNT